MSIQFPNRSMIKGLSVTVQDGRFDKAFGQFNRAVQDSGILKEIKDRMYFESNPAKKQRRLKMAKKRWQKKMETSDPRTPLSRKKVKKIKKKFEENDK